MKPLKRIFSIFLSFSIVALIFSVLAPKAKAAGLPIETGIYYIVNAKTGMYLSIEANTDADGTKVQITTPKVDEVRQVMKVKANTALSGGSYFIQPAESTTRSLNTIDSVPKSGSDVKLKLHSASKNQDWYFEKMTTDKDGSIIYAIKSGYNSNLALTAEGEKDSSLVGVATYSSSNLLQGWKLVPFTIAKEGDDPAISSYGIDVSQWQGEINWQAVAEYGVEFAIIRIGYSGRNEKNGGLDPKFYQNYDAARANNLAIGTYIYSYSTTVEDARLDAEQVLAQLGGRHLEYPVFFDIEDEKYQSGLSARLKTDMCLEFMRVIKEAGYEAGVYASESWFKNHLYYSEIKAAGATWLAKWPKSNQADQDHSAEELWQYRSDGRVAGIGGGVKDVDMNVSYYTPETYSYTGSPITPSFKVYSPFNGSVLQENVHYKVAYKNNLNVGSAQAVVTGIGEYADKLYIVKEFQILPRAIEAAEATISDRTYSGIAITPSPKIVFGGKTLKKGKDYTVTYKNNLNAGKATATVNAMGNYVGKITLNFEIKKKNVKYADFEGIKNMAYTGKKIKLSGLKVKTSAKTLKKGTDYEVSYSNNKDFGTATVTIKGIGKNCKGTIKKTFGIVPKKHKSLKASSTKTTKTTLKWSHVDYATKYQLYRATDPNGKFTKIYTTPSRWVYSYTDTSLKKGTFYYYKIRAYKTVDGKKYYGAWSDVITVKTKINNTTFKA